MGADLGVRGGTWVYGMGSGLCASLRQVYLLYLVAFACGLAGITVLSSFQVAAQSSIPPWVRARGTALYITVFSAGMAGGSLGWGALAQQRSPELELLGAGLGTPVARNGGWRFKPNGRASWRVKGWVKQVGFCGAGRIKKK